MTRAAACGCLLVVLAASTACGRIFPSHNGPRIYVSDETGGNIDIVDPDAGRVIDRIAVGKRPRGIVLAHDGRRVFVALSGSPIGGPNVDESALPPADRAADGIGVVDVATHKLLRKYKSGADPEAFAVSADDRTIFISNEDAGEMSVLDVASGDIQAHVKVGDEPEGVTIRPDGKVVYITCEGTNEVYAIDTGAFQVLAKMTTAARPRAVAFTPDGTLGFVTSETGGAVTVIDPARNVVVKTIVVPKDAANPIPPRPMGVTLSRDAKSAFVTLGREKDVIQIDVAGQAITRRIADVGTRPWGIATSLDGTRLYTANGPSGDVSVLDIASGTIERRITVGGSPWGVAVPPAR
jgi:YVTN family beta-propeller protein